MTVLERIFEKKKPIGKEREFVRFSFAQRFQHFVQLLSFFTLVATGAAMKFSNSLWAKESVTLVGGFDRLLVIHIFAGTVITWLCLYHFFYLIGLLSEGKLKFTMLPNAKDIKDFFGNMAFLLGLTDKKPKFSRYSYKEKMDYLAEWWGMFLMVTTGFLLWFPGQIGAMVPRWMLDVARLIHSYEATLAFLVIITWHLFGVVFSPYVFPGSRVWLTGKIPEPLMIEEHPLEWEALFQEKPDLIHHQPSSFRAGLAILEIVVYLVVLLFVLKAFLPTALG